MEVIRILAIPAACLLAVAGMPGPGDAQSRSTMAGAEPAGATIRATAAQAYVWGMPLVEAALVRERFTDASGDGGASAGQINRFKHRRTLAGPEMKAGVGPNNDTIYSLAWVDLSQGPLVVTAPDFGSRYYTISINHADSSSDQSLGQRTHGGHLPPLFIHGPDYRGRVPKGMVGVAGRTRYLNLAARILVRSPSEYPAVHALQDQLAIHKWADWRKGRHVAAPVGAQSAMATGPDGASEAMRFYYRLGSLLQDWHVHPREGAIINALAGLSITRQSGFRPDKLTGAQRAQMELGYAMAKSRVARASLALGVQQNGWTTNFRGPRFGSDWLLRAAVAKDQIFVAIPEEAVYPIGRVDADGRALRGSHRYTIRFAPDALPPVDAFWSITAYDDAGHMIPNAIDRYSVGDRTDGLVRARDGSVTILLASTPPAPEQGVNWLPVAADEPFYLMMRLYLPRRSVLAQSWTPPPIVRLDRMN